ncbi:VOC family protein [Streptomyces sp. NPDC050439]|uniref:VOC family protein n=1 Tax=unclassified Streptomyces TaxID=2593676 RepID=UPI00344AEC71
MTPVTCRGVYRLCRPGHRAGDAGLPALGRCRVERSRVGPARRLGLPDRLTTDGPPFIELVEGAQGSPWDASAGARFDHIGFWSSDVEEGSRRLEAEGFPVDFSGCPHGRQFVYHRMDSVGARMELVDVSRRGVRRLNRQASRAQSLRDRRRGVRGRG